MKRNTSAPPGVSVTSETPDPSVLFPYLRPVGTFTRRYFLHFPDPSVLFPPGTRRYSLFWCISDPSVLLQKYRWVRAGARLRIYDPSVLFNERTDGSEMAHLCNLFPNLHPVGTFPKVPTGQGLCTCAHIWPVGTFPKVPTDQGFRSLDAPRTRGNFPETPPTE